MGEFFLNTLYTPWVEKNCHQTLLCIFAKCRSLFSVLSPAHSADNLQQNCCQRSRLFTTFLFHKVSVATRSRCGGIALLTVLSQFVRWVCHLIDGCLKVNKKAQLAQRERATAVHVWRPTANKRKNRENLYSSAQGHSRSLLSVSIETRVWLPISD